MVADEKDEADEPTAPEDVPAYGEDESQDYVDRSKLDFDPADGLYTGTAVTGDSDIPDVGDADPEDADTDAPDDRPKPFPHDGNGPDDS